MKNCRWNVLGVWKCDRQTKNMTGICDECWKAAATIRDINNGEGLDQWWALMQLKRNAELTPKRRAALEKASRAASEKRKRLAQSPHN